jgi:acetyl esterase/lipase
MAVDPQVQALLEQLAASGQRPIDELPIDEARTVAAMLAPFDGEPEPVAAVEDRTISTRDGAIAVRIYRARESAASLPIVAWFHAGGGVIGDLDTADRTCRKLANRTGAAIVSVDYRRAPEHRFPAAIDDCWTVTLWLAHHGAELGLDPARIAVGGDSMGGTFAAVVAQRAAREGGPALRHQLLVYPFTDLTLSHPSIGTYADGYLLTRSLMRWFVDHYLGPDVDRSNPLVSPLHAESVDGVAPATLIIAELDPARDEAVAYGEKLRRAGVPVDVVHCEGMIHVFFALGGMIDRAHEIMDQAAAALCAALASQNDQRTRARGSGS